MCRFAAGDVFVCNPSETLWKHSHENIAATQVISMLVLEITFTNCTRLLEYSSSPINLIQDVHRRKIDFVDCPISSQTEMTNSDEQILIVVRNTTISDLVYESCF